MMNEIDKETYHIQKQEEVKQLSQMIEKGIIDCRNSDKFKNYLLQQSKMPRYSVNNCLLILAQSKGQASQVASYTTWKSLGRDVNKGEKGLKIFCPAPYKKTISVDKKDSHGNPVLNKDGKPVYEYAEVNRVGYKPAYVFDISQTSGKELVEPCTRLTGDVKDYKDLVNAIKQISPVPIFIERIEGPENGYFKYSDNDKKIVVSDQLEPLQQVKTTLHELAHAYLYENGLDDNRSREEKETEAEAISFILINNLLKDQVTPELTGEYSFGYMATWGDDKLSELKDCLDIIQKSSCSLIKDIERAWTNIIKQREEINEQPVQEKAELETSEHKQHMHM